jgi:hypothetical protein
MDNANINIHDNIFKAVVTSANPSYRARAFVLDGVDPGINPLVAHDVFESNDASLGLTDGSGGAVDDVLLLGDTLRKSAGGASRLYTGVAAGYYNRAIHDVRLIDTRYEGGASPAITWGGTGVKDIEVGWLVSVAVRGADGTPQAGATVKVSDKTGAQVATGTTDASGLLTGIPLVAVVYTQGGTSPAAITATTSGPFQVVAQGGKGKGSALLNLTGDTSLTLTLS